MALQDKFGGFAFGTPNRLAKAIEETAKRLRCTTALDKGCPVNITGDKFVKGDATQGNYGVLIDQLNDLNSESFEVDEFATAVTSGFIYVKIEGALAIGDTMKYDLTKKLWVKDSAGTATSVKFVCDEVSTKDNIAIMRILDTAGA